LNRPAFFASIRLVDLSMMALGVIAGKLRVEGATRQHPLYYRANQFWRQLDEFRSDLRHAAEGALPPIVSAGGG
jgi:hypothetical protein